MGNSRSVPSQDSGPWPITLEFQCLNTQHILVMLPRQGELSPFPVVPPLLWVSVSLKRPSFLPSGFFFHPSGYFALILECVWPLLFQAPLSAQLIKSSEELSGCRSVTLRCSHAPSRPYPCASVPNILEKLSIPVTSFPAHVVGKWNNCPTRKYCCDFPHVKSKSNCWSFGFLVLLAPLFR